MNFFRVQGQKQYFKRTHTKKKKTKYGFQSCEFFFCQLLEEEFGGNLQFLRNKEKNEWVFIPRNILA
jgi:hypothetical protein